MSDRKPLLITTESMNIIIASLTESLDLAWQEINDLSAQLERESAELTAMYAGDHPQRLLDLQLNVELALDNPNLPKNERNRLLTALAESRRRPDDPN